MAESSVNQTVCTGKEFLTAEIMAPVDNQQQINVVHDEALHKETSAEHVQVSHFMLSYLLE
jgi:hypothetical protein